MKMQKSLRRCFRNKPDRLKMFAAVLVVSFISGLLLTGCGSKETEAAAGPSDSAEKSDAKSAPAQPTAAQEAAKQRAEAQGDAIHAASQAAHGAH